MNATEKSVLLGAAVMAASIAAFAITPTTKVGEYSVINDRNPFGLVDPPPPKTDEKPKPPKEETPPPNVQLTGFFRNARSGKTVALFLVEKKKGEPKESYMWAVDEGDDGMKVLAINRDEKTVKLSVRGVESTITFSKPSPVATPTAPVLPIPGRPNQRIPNIPAAPNGAAPAGPRQFENMRAGSFGRSRTSSAAVGGAMPNRLSGVQANALQAIPSRNLRTVGGEAQTGAQTTPQQSLTPQEQAVLIELNREVIKQSGQIMPPLPPTPLTTPEDRARIIVQPNPGQGTPYPQQ
jgi:hypothetical protein